MNGEYFVLDRVVSVQMFGKLCANVRQTAYVQKEQ